MSAQSESERLLSITELAQDLGLTPRAIRFYESKGLVTPQRAGTMRVYTHRDRSRLAIILRGKRLGFTLAEIQEYLDLYDVDPMHTSQAKLLLEGIRQRIGQMESQQNDLELTLEELRDLEKQTLIFLKSEVNRPDGG